MGKKRGQGTGSITKRKDGRYVVRLPIDGVRRTIGYARTAEEADRKLTAAKAERDRGVAFIADSVTLNDYAAEWLAIKRPDLKETTYRRYEALLRIHFLPTLGKVPLKKITPAQLQRLEHARRGAPVAGRTHQVVGAVTVQRAHAVLHALLEDARRLGHVTINVCESVRPPRGEPRELHPLTLEQVDALLDAVRGERLEAIYVLALATGLREGELLALKWKDVDLGAGTLRVVATLSRPPGGAFAFTAPKTRDSARTIALGAAAVEALRAHHARQTQERCRLGKCWQDLDLVFPAEDGTPLAAYSLAWRYRRARARAGLPSTVRFHDLRHTYATLLRELGLDIKDISAALGHSGTTITADLYMHATTASQRRVADKADAIVQRRERSR